MELPVVKELGSSMKPKFWELYKHTSIANLLSVVAICAMAVKTNNSVFPRDNCAFTTFTCGDSKPNNSVVYFLSKGKDDPYPAPEPSGFLFARRKAASSNSISSTRLSAYAPNQSPKDEGIAICKCV